MTDKIYTREEFEEYRKELASRMRKDKNLQKQANGLIEDALKYKLVHQMNWMDEPTLQLPQDLLAIQEVIRKLNPQLVIEVGVCWGGTTLMMSSILAEQHNQGWIIGIDKYIPEDLEDRLSNKADLLYLIEGDSLSEDTLWKVRTSKQQIPNSCLVVLDSLHTEEHVLNELEAYSEFADYFVVCDTIIEDLKQPVDRPWGPGNSPRTAINRFLEANKNWERDEDICNKMLISCQPDGYLKRKS